jgi:hypothetical protein
MLFLPDCKEDPSDQPESPSDVAGSPSSAGMGGESVGGRSSDAGRGGTANAGEPGETSEAGDGGASTTPSEPSGVLHDATVTGANDLWLNSSDDRLVTTVLPSQHVIVYAADGMRKVTLQKTAWSNAIDPIPVFQIAGYRDGSFVTAVDLDTAQLGEDISALSKTATLVTRFDALGNEVWNHWIPTGDASSPDTSRVRSMVSEIAPDADGGTLVVGYAMGLFEDQLNPDVEDADETVTSMFIANISAQGERLWVTQYLEEFLVSAYAFDAAGDVYVSGYARPDGESLAPLVGFHLTKLSKDPERSWTKTYSFEDDRSGSPVMRVASIAVSDDGSIIYIGGESTVDLGSEGYPPFETGGYGLFAARFDDEGEMQWSTSLRPSMDLECPAISDCSRSATAVDLAAASDGSVAYLVGQSLPDVAGMRNQEGLLAAKIQSDGSTIWFVKNKSSTNANFESLYGDAFIATALDSTETPVVMGTTGGRFDGTSPPSNASLDLFIGRLNVETGELY